MIDDLTFWAVTLGLGAGTFGMRAVFVFALGRMEIPPDLKTLLRFVPPAVLAALAIPAFIMSSGEVDFLLGKERLAAGLLAAIVAWKSRNMLLTILCGMAVLYLLQALERLQ